MVTHKLLLWTKSNPFFTNYKMCIEGRLHSHACSSMFLRMKMKLCSIVLRPCRKPACSFLIKCLVHCIPDAVDYDSESANHRCNPCSGLPAVYLDLSTRLDCPFQKGNCSKNSQELELEVSCKRANNGIKTQIKIILKRIFPENCWQVIRSLWRRKRCLLIRDTVKSSRVRRNVRLVKALPLCVEFVGGPEQGFRSCFADVTNRELNYVGRRLNHKQRHSPPVAHFLASPFLDSLTMS